MSTQEDMGEKSAEIVNQICGILREASETYGFDRYETVSDELQIIWNSPSQP